MMWQILLNINFCDDVETYNIEKTGRKIEVVTGYSLGGIRLVPQEFAGVCVLYISGKAHVIRLQDISCADRIECACGFVIVQPDTTFRASALNDETCRDLILSLGGRDQLRDPELYKSDVGRILEMDKGIWLPENKTSSRIEVLEDLIHNRCGHISLTELAENAGCTVRHVHRMFVDEIGKSPKEFAKTVRVRETVQRMLEDPCGRINDYMEGMGYSDQAHFQREFKWYTGITPGNFLKMLQDKIIMH